MVSIKKKGQAEMIGLVIVVLLLIFAFVFFVRVKMSEDESGSRLIRSNLRANSALNALMKVNVDGKKQMKDLIGECFESGGCEDAKANLTHYLPLIFEGNDNYNLTVEGEEKEELTPEVGKDCENSISASPYIIRGKKIEFEICT